jgi:hypothetical protein
MVNEILSRMAKKTKEKKKTLKSCNSCTMSFDLWMLRARMDTFVFIVHFLNDKWEPCDTTIDFFETTNILCHGFVS